MRKVPDVSSRNLLHSVLTDVVLWLLFIFKCQTRRVGVARCEILSKSAAVTCTLCEVVSTPDSAVQLMMDIMYAGVRRVRAAF